MNLDAVIQTFIVESAEMLDSMEESLLALENDPANSDLINSVFRAAHTIKGSAGIFGFDAIVSFTHQVESLLDKIRDGELRIDSATIALLLQCGDHMRAIIGPVTGGAELDDATVQNGAKLTEQLREKLGGKQPVAVETTGTVTAITPKSEATDNSGSATSEFWHISLRFGRDVLRNGMDPLSFLRYLARLGDVKQIVTLTDALPDMADLDAEACYLGFEITLDSSASKSDIEQTFEFVREDCQLHILPPHSRISSYISLIDELPESASRLGEILVQVGALTPFELVQCLELQAKQSAQHASTGVAPPAQPLGEIIVAKQVADASVVEAALGKQQKDAERKPSESRFIRVDAEKLDQLINLVGELVIAGASTQLHAQRAGDSALIESTVSVARLVEEVRNNALSLRMVQIGSTFQKFQRVVRDVSRDLGKDIDLIINGGETELDKSVVEKIGDPLMHLVRNAMDHGIENAETRQANNKPAKAHVTLNAYHDSGSIVIEVSDDGGGLRREKILAKAMERGLVSSSQTLSDREVYALIFEAGFSTAEAVSNLSGRGVGMDVVRRNIEALRGTIELESEAGKGTTVRIRLPLTLAIIDGFLVGIGPSHFVIPLDMVVECMEFSAADTQAARDRGFINLRGNALPVVDLGDIFELGASTANRRSIVVVKWGAYKAGLVVDELLGEFQTVIKPLGRLFSHIKGISGSTILGSGEVALILDASSLVQQISEQDSLTNNVTAGAVTQASH